MPKVAKQVTHIPASTRVDGVDIHLSSSEAEMLRRVCYYNITVGNKFSANRVAGGYRKGQEITAFMTSLGNKLKAEGIARF